MARRALLHKGFKKGNRRFAHGGWVDKRDLCWGKMRDEDEDGICVDRGRRGREAETALTDWHCASQKSRVHKPRERLLGSLSYAGRCRIVSGQQKDRAT